MAGETHPKTDSAEQDGSPREGCATQASFLEGLMSGWALRDKGGSAKQSAEGHEEGQRGDREQQVRGCSRAGSRVRQGKRRLVSMLGIAGLRYTERGRDGDCVRQGVGGHDKELGHCC